MVEELKDLIRNWKRLAAEHKRLAADAEGLGKVMTHASHQASYTLCAEQLIKVLNAMPAQADQLRWTNADEVSGDG